MAALDYKITPENILHKTLEKNIISILEARGYYIHSCTYHETMPENVRNILSKRFEPTALYLRGRADRIAIAIEPNLPPLQFEFECKTHSSYKYNDMTLEMLPLAHHIAKSKLDVNCLYIYSTNSIPPKIYGFWADQILPIRQIRISERRYTQEGVKFFTNIAEIYFPGVEIFYYNWETKGTDDPFVIIDESIVKTLEDWLTLVLQKEAGVSNF